MPQNPHTVSRASASGPRHNTGAAGRSRQQRGFTLIEVIVALTITGFLLGGLFALVGGSKQLSWRAEDVLVRATQQRTAWNFALLDNEYADLEPILDEEFYTVRESSTTSRRRIVKPNRCRTRCAHSSLCPRTAMSKLSRCGGYGYRRARVVYDRA